MKSIIEIVNENTLEINGIGLLILTIKIIIDHYFISNGGRIEFPFESFDIK